MVVVPAFVAKSIGTPETVVAYGFDDGIRATVKRLEILVDRADGETNGLQHSVSLFVLAISVVVIEEQDSSEVAKRSKRLLGTDYKGHPI